MSNDLLGFKPVDETKQGPLIKHKGRWAAFTAVLTAGALATWGYMSGVRVQDVTNYGKQRFASTSEKIEDLRDGPARRQVQVSLDVTDGADPKENAYGNIRMAPGELVQDQFPRDADRFVPITGKDDCLIDAKLFVSDPLPGTAITATYLVGLPQDQPGLAGAREVRSSTPKRGAVQIVNLARLADGTGGATPDGIYTFHVMGDREGAGMGQREGADTIRTAEATVEISEQGQKVTLDGQEVDCDVTGKGAIVPVKAVERNNFGLN